ncbi:hypothetical protein TWF694_000233 [Orbilia ellipsospora]|uniref:Uncharacterized protein n=1 Tax=Orbilia ellipsospora TaxID=2528407 RepID=A0AAV9XRD6_9PEZI
MPRYENTDPAERAHYLNLLVHGKRYEIQKKRAQSLVDPPDLNKPLPPISLTQNGEPISPYTITWDPPLPSGERYAANIRLEELGRGRSSGKKPPPSAWWDVRQYVTKNSHQSVKEGDTDSESSGELETIWVEVDWEERINRELPPLPPRKDQKYRRPDGQINEWKLFKRYCLNSRDSTPSDQGRERRRAEADEDEEEDNDTGRASKRETTMIMWVSYGVLILIISFIIAFITWIVNHQPPSKAFGPGVGNFTRGVGFNSTKNWAGSNT